MGAEVHLTYADLHLSTPWTSALEDNDIDPQTPPREFIGEPNIRSLCPPTTETGEEQGNLGPRGCTFTDHDTQIADDLLLPSSR